MVYEQRTVARQIGDDDQTDGLFDAIREETKAHAKEQN
jgi:hypothetical protein